MPITYDATADAVCIYLTGAPLTLGRTTIQAATPASVDAFIALDWKNDRLVRLEILDLERARSQATNRAAACIHRL